MDEFEQFLKQQPMRSVPDNWRRDILHVAQPAEPAATVNGWWRRFARPALAVAVVIAAMMLYQQRRPHEMPTVTLASGWRIKPTGQAAYRVLNPDLIRLDRGELFVESDGAAKSRSPLKIETPTGRATAKGTMFYIGTHADNPKRNPQMNNITRILILTGVVTLANTHGEATGKANDLLVAEPGKAPANQAIAANSDFAVDLYGALAKENPGQNLFFSPYSMSSALAMTAEGARGETAEQMGKVLRFPQAARRIGNDAQLLPWNTAQIHTGMSVLNEQFQPKPVAPEMHARIEVLRKELAASEEQKKKFYDALQYKEGNDQRQKSWDLMAELSKLAEQTNQYELRVANALYGEKTYPFRQEYLETIHKFYGTGAVVPVDFIRDFEAARGQINASVEKQTNERIKGLIAKGGINDLTRLVLINAISFKGEWAIPFDAKNTKEEEFLSPASKVPVSMMRQNDMKGIRYGAFNADGSVFNTPHEARLSLRERNDPSLYPQKDGFLMAELPYKGKELQMVVLVPQDAGGLGDLEKKLNSANLQKWIGLLQDRKVNVQMPKFKLEADYPKMKETLQAMGMVRAFNDPRDPVGGAQFDGMCASSDPRLKLYITKVCHKAFVEVNEKGTEAAAATAGVLGVPRSADAIVSFTPTFRADKPFLFAIRDVKTGTILFLGRIVDPTK